MIGRYVNSNALLAIEDPALLPDLPLNSNGRAVREYINGRRANGVVFTAENRDLTEADMPNDITEGGRVIRNAIHEQSIAAKIISHLPNRDRLPAFPGRDNAVGVRLYLRSLVGIERQRGPLWGTITLDEINDLTLDNTCMLIRDKIVAKLEPVAAVPAGGVHPAPPPPPPPRLPGPAEAKAKLAPLINDPRFADLQASLNALADQPQAAPIIGAAGANINVTAFLNALRPEGGAVPNRAQLIIALNAGLGVVLEDGRGYNAELNGVIAAMNNVVRAHKVLAPLYALDPALQESLRRLVAVAAAATPIAETAVNFDLAAFNGNLNATVAPGGRPTTAQLLAALQAAGVNLPANADYNAQLLAVAVAVPARPVAAPPPPPVPPPGPAEAKAKLAPLINDPRFADLRASLNALAEQAQAAPIIGGAGANIDVAAFLNALQPPGGGVSTKAELISALNATLGVILVDGRGYDPELNAVVAAMNNVVRAHKVLAPLYASNADLEGPLRALVVIPTAAAAIVGAARNFDLAAFNGSLNVTVAPGDRPTAAQLITALQAAGVNLPANADYDARLNDVAVAVPARALAAPPAHPAPPAPPLAPAGPAEAKAKLAPLINDPRFVDLQGSLNALADQPQAALIIGAAGGNINVTAFLNALQPPGGGVSTRAQLVAALNAGLGVALAEGGVYDNELNVVVAAMNNIVRAHKVLAPLYDGMPVLQASLRTLVAIPAAATAIVAAAANLDMLAFERSLIAAASGAAPNATQLIAALGAGGVHLPANVLYDAELARVATAVPPPRAGMTEDQANRIIKAFKSNAMRHTIARLGQADEETMRTQLMRQPYTKDGIGLAFDNCPFILTVGGVHDMDRLRRWKSCLDLDHMPPNNDKEIDSHLLKQYSKAQTYKKLQDEMKELKISESDVKKENADAIVTVNRDTEFMAIPVRGFDRKTAAGEQAYNVVKDRRDSIHEVLINYKKQTDELKFSERSEKELRDISDFVHEQKMSLEKYKKSVSEYALTDPKKYHDRIRNVDTCLAEIKSIEDNMTYIRDNPPNDQRYIVKPERLSAEEKAAMALAPRAGAGAGGGGGGGGAAVVGASLPLEDALAQATAYVGAGGPTVIGFGMHRGDLPEEKTELRAAQARCVARKYINGRNELIRIAAVEERGTGYVRSQFVFATQPVPVGNPNPLGPPIYPFEDEKRFRERHYGKKHEIPGMACLEWAANEIKSIVLRTPPALQSEPIILPETNTLAPNMLNALRLYCEYKKIPYEPKNTALTEHQHALFEKKYSETHPNDLSAKALEEKKTQSYSRKSKFGG